MIEYTALLVIIMLVFLSFQKYVVRGFAGRWKETGDAFGYGRQYDPTKTIECVSWQQNQEILYVPGEYKTAFESYYPGCLADCSSNTSSSFGSCASSRPPVTCCYSTYLGIECHPNCCYDECRARCDEAAVLASANICNQP